MKALVTGGAGFIGSNLVAALLDRGDEVVVIDNLLSGYEVNLAELPGAKFARADIRDSEAVLEAGSGAAVVFHLGASVGNYRSIEHPLDDSEINLMGTLTVLEAMRKLGIRRIVLSSSAAIFGELKHLPIREDHPLDPESPYAVSKLAAEKMCLAYSKLFDIEAVCLRYFNVYGVNQRFDAYGNVIPIFAHRLFRDEPLVIYGDGEQTRDFCNVKDVVRANIQAADASGLSGAFNIASGSSITIKALAELMIELSGRNPGIEYGPPRPGDVRDSLADLEAASKAFGYAPRVDLKEGLEEYVDWVQREIG